MHLRTAMSVYSPACRSTVAVGLTSANADVRPAVVLHIPVSEIKIELAAITVFAVLAWPNSACRIEK